MKNIHLIVMLSIITLFILFSCTPHTVSKSHLVTIDGKEMLVGLIDQHELFSAFPVFRENYDLFTPHDSTIQFIKSFQKDISVQIYLGTWCGDTREQLPLFLKIFDKSANGKIKIFLRAADRTKIDPEKTSLQFAIKRVPTLVFLHNGVEFGRFVETPELNVEDDLIKILKRCP